MAALSLLCACISPSLILAQKVTDEVAVSRKCWNFPTDAAPESGLASDITAVFFAAAGGRISAVETVSGKNAWNAELGGRAVSNILVHGSDVIAVTAPVAEAGKEGTASLRSLSKATGIVNWTVPVRLSERYFLGTTPSGLISVSSEGDVKLLGYQGGFPLWDRSLSGQLAAPPHIDAVYVIVPIRSGKTHVISAVNGSVVSTFESTPRVQSQARVAERWVVSGDDRGNLIVNNFLTGKLQWKFKAGAKWTYVEGTKFGIAAVSADNFVYMLSVEHGSVIWKRRLPGRVSGVPALSDSYVIIASYGENTAHVIDLANGRIVNQITLGENNSFTESPVLISDDSFAAATNSGISLWSFVPCAPNQKAALNVPPK